MLKRMDTLHLQRKQFRELERQKSTVEFMLGTPRGWTRDVAYREHRSLYIHSGRNGGGWTANLVDDPPDRGSTPAAFWIAFEPTIDLGYGAHACRRLHYATNVTVT
jgi:hypothetical protein